MGQSGGSPVPPCRLSLGSQCGYGCRQQPGILHTLSFLQKLTNWKKMSMNLRGKKSMISNFNNNLLILLSLHQEFTSAKIARQWR
ncbi:hypothetical protein ACUSIJ_13035 [Pseudochelatococcus sp. B33]